MNFLLRVYIVISTFVVSTLLFNPVIGAALAACQIMLVGFIQEELDAE